MLSKDEEMQFGAETLLGDVRGADFPPVRAGVVTAEERSGTDYLPCSFPLPIYLFCSCSRDAARGL